MQSKINLIAHHYGLHSRLDKTAEECLELALALMHHKERGGEIDHITEEIADVEIMLEQMRKFVPEEEKHAKTTLFAQWVCQGEGITTSEAVSSLCKIADTLVSFKMGKVSQEEASMKITACELLLIRAKNKFEIKHFAVGQWKEIKVKRQMERMRLEG